MWATSYSKQLCRETSKEVRNYLSRLLKGISLAATGRIIQFLAFCLAFIIALWLYCWVCVCPAFKMDKVAVEIWLI